MLGKSASVLGLLGIVLFAVAVCPALGADEPRSITLHVVAAEDQTPLPDAKITVQIDFQSDELTTDQNGQAVIDLPKGTPQFVSIKASNPRRVPVQLRFQSLNGKLGKLPDPYIFALEKGTSIGGIVVDDAGDPISGATVLLAIQKKSDRPNEFIGVSYLPLTTDKAGRWSFGQAPANPDTVRIGVYHPQHASHEPGYGFYRLDEVDSVSELLDGSATTTLQRGVTLSGVVTGPDGLPIQGAGIGVGKDRVATNVVPEQKSDEQGRFFVALHPGESTLLTVHAPGFAPQQVVVAGSADAQPLQIPLNKGHTLEGRVVDAKGNPIGSATIASDTWRGARSYLRRVQTDADGRFTIEDLPEDTVYYSVFKNGYTYIQQHPMRADQEPQTITMLAPLKVSGRVVAASDGRPIESFKVIPGIEWGNGQSPYFERRNARQGGAGRYEIGFTFPRAGHYVRIEADGYKPAISRMFTDNEGIVTFDFRLERGSDIAGVIRSPNGDPAAGAQIIFATTSQPVRISDGHHVEQSDAQSVTTGADGAYSFPPTDDLSDWFLIAVHDSGYAEVHRSAIAESAVIDLRAWSNIDGELAIRGAPKSDQRIKAISLSDSSLGGAPVWHELNTVTDASGKFAFKRVPPIDIAVVHVEKIGTQDYYSRHSYPDLEPGAAAHITIGGSGRPVEGRVVVAADLKDIDLTSAQARLMSRPNKQPPQPSFPDAWQQLDPEQQRQKYTEWLRSDEGQAYRKQVNELSRGILLPMAIAHDGSFRLEDVPAGKYALRIQIMGAPTNNFRFGEPTASAGLEFILPPVDNEQFEEPYQIGSIVLKAVAKLVNVDIGDAAPAFQVPTIDGDLVKLSDLRGRYVLLDFWATWCGPCLGETPNLKKVWDTYGNDNRFAMIGLSLDEDPDAPRKYAEKKQLGWTQAFLGDWSQATLPAEYGVRGIPSIWLIGPDGNVIAKDLRGPAIERAVRQVLAASNQ